MSYLDENSLNMSGYSIQDIFIGMKKSVSKTISESDVYTYAGLIGDINPVHVNEEYAKTTRFGKRIAHGMLTASLFSTIVGMLIPGADAIYLGQTGILLLQQESLLSLYQKRESLSWKLQLRIKKEKL